MKRIIFGLCTLAAAGLAQAGDANIADTLKACAACHGENGDKPIAPEYPVLAGQYEDFLAYALKAYRNGERKNPIMSGQAANLNDAQISALARFYARQPGPLYTPVLPTGN